METTARERAHSLTAVGDFTDEQTSTSILAEHELVIDKLEVEVTVGPDAGTVSVAEGTELSAGKAPANKLVLDPSAVSFRAAKEAALGRWEQEYLADLMKKYGNNISRASRGARMDRNHLRELLRRHALAPQPIKSVG